MSNFQVSSTNPNDGIGGGGCLCSPVKHEDCKGPYAIFPATETDSSLSPYVVLSLTCAKAVCKSASAALKSGDMIAPGTPGTVEGTAEEL